MPTTNPGRTKLPRSETPAVIAVHLEQTWPHVLAGELTAQYATLHAWKLKDRDYAGTLLLGHYNGVVVTAYRITDSFRSKGGRVAFEGEPLPERVGERIAFQTTQQPTRVFREGEQVTE